MNTKKQVNYEIEVTLSYIGGKWKPLILSLLIDRGTLRFSEIEKYIRNTSKRHLSTQLKELQEDGLISRHVEGTQPVKVLYSITEKGRSLSPILLKMCEWGFENAGDRFEILNGECQS